MVLDEVTTRFSCPCLRNVIKNENKSSHTASCLLKLTHMMSSINYFFNAKGSWVPLWLGKLISEAAGENKLNYIVTILFINYGL